MEKSIITSMLTATFISLFSSGVFGAFGAMVQYLYLVVNEKEKYSTSGTTYRATIAASNMKVHWSNLIEKYG